MAEQRALPRGTLEQDPLLEALIAAAREAIASRREAAERRAKLRVVKSRAA